MSAHKDYTKQTPTTQRTIISKDGSIKLFLDENCCLLVKSRHEKYPYPIDVTSVHQLLNVLWLHRAEIIQEASKHNGVGKPGHASGSESIWS